MPRRLGYESETGIPYRVRVSINRGENVEKALDVDVLRRDSLCFFEAGLAGKGAT